MFSKFTAKTLLSVIGLLLGKRAAETHSMLDGATCSFTTPTFDGNQWQCENAIDAEGLYRLTIMDQ